MIKESIKGRFYIGSSKDVYTRLHRHKSDLIHKRHANVILQNIYNKYKDCMYGELLEVCKEKNLKVLEQKYINQLKPYINIIKDVEKNCPPMTKKRRQQISNSLKKGYRDGRIQPTKTRKVYVWTAKTGEFIGTFNKIIDCVKELNLSLNTVRKVLSKQQYHHKGYHISYNNSFTKKKFNPYTGKFNKNYFRYMDYSLYKNDTLIFTGSISDMTSIINFKESTLKVYASKPSKNFSKEYRIVSHRLDNKTGRIAGTPLESTKLQNNL